MSKFDIEQVRLLAKKGGDAYSQDILNAYRMGGIDLLNDMAGEFETMRELSEGFGVLADYHGGMAKKWRFTWHLSMILVGAFAGLWVYEAYNFLNDLNKGGIC
jgi:hypothetical protein